MFAAQDNDLAWLVMGSRILGVSDPNRLPAESAAFFASVNLVHRVVISAQVSMRLGFCDRDVMMAT